MGRSLRIIRAIFSRYAWGVLLLMALIAVTNISVKRWKASNPGAMTVLEAQSMDISTMEPPESSVPVSTEIVRPGPFNAAVTYTGSVAPLQEQVIYPRVDGWLTGLEVYNGDRVSQGQVLAMVDSPDLRSRAAEASAGYAAAVQGILVTESNVARTWAERAASQADVEAALGELQRAEGMVAAAQKAVIQAQKDVKSAQASLDYWRAEIARQENLLKAGAVSLQEYQLEKAQAISAEAELENRDAKLAEAQANVSALNGEVTSRRAGVRAARQRAAAASAALAGANRQVGQTSAAARQAKATAATASIVDSYRYLRAPFAGTVTRRYVSPGQLVTTSTAVLDIVQTDLVRLQANVADKDLPFIATGAPVTSRLAKYPDMVIRGAVTSVSPLANQNSRTAMVESIVSNPKHKLVPGDYVTLTITTSRSESAITVPVSAVVQKNAMSAVWIARPERVQGMSRTSPGAGTGMREHSQNRNTRAGSGAGTKRAHLVMVSTGATDGRRVEILSGLLDGDEVIYQGNSYLREGDTVFPTEWGAEGPVELPQPPAAAPMSQMGGPSSKRGDTMPRMDH